MTQEPIFAAINIGQNKGRPRLWLEGARLSAVGIRPGMKFDAITATATPGAMSIAVHADGKRTVSGKGDKPIIDILGRTIEAAGFKTGDKVQVTFFALGKFPALFVAKVHA